MQKIEYGYSESLLSQMFYSGLFQCETLKAGRDGPVELDETEWEHIFKSNSEILSFPKPKERRYCIEVAKTNSV